MEINREPSYRIRGIIVDSRTRRGMAGLRVEAWDKDLLVDDLVGSAVTDAQGTFEITFTRGHFRELFLDRSPDLYFKVFRDRELIASTENTVLWNAQAGDVPVTISLEGKQVEPPDDPGVPSWLSVRGTIRDADGQPVAGGRVEVFDQDMRTRQRLGEVRTDASGAYELTYTAKQFRRAEKERADLVVRVLDAGGAELGVSDTVFNAPPEATIDLVIGGGTYRGPSELERLVAEITPLLDGVAIGDLREDEEHRDIFFLGRETGEDPQAISFLAAAHRLAQQTALPAEALYGLFRQALPTDLPALVAQSEEVVRRSLVQAAEENIIPPRFGRAAEVESVLARLEELRVQETLQPSTDPDDGGASLGELLGTSLPEPELRREFVRTYLNHQGPVEQFWTTLAERSQFRDRVADLQLTLQIGALAAGHLPLVREIQRMRADGEVTTLADLARLDEQGWRELVGRPGPNGPIGAPRHVPGSDDEEKRRNYARAIAHMVEDAFPTAFLTYRLASDRAATEPLPGRGDLVTFLTSNPDYDIRATRLESYLREHPWALDGVQDEQGTRQRLEGLQRVYRIAPRYEQAVTLVRDGIDSALRISRIDPQVLQRTHPATFSLADAERVHASARQVTATTQLLFLEYASASSKLSMSVVRDEAVQDVGGIPEWSTLFGSVELCACEHCRSVYSPAAYLVDILHFLHDRKSRIPGSSARDILFLRRPDLGEIELTCENTNTPLPYVDLVTEVLEDAVAPPGDFDGFDMPVAVESDLDTRTVSPALRDAFTPPLSLDAVITSAAQGRSRPPDATSWTIDEPGYTYAIRKEGRALQVVSRSRQTRGTAAERAAEPQYINRAAYEEHLARAVHPWSLPFHLAWEEARVYLDHLGVPHHGIMETFRPGEPDEALAAVDVAREYLGLTSAEADIVTGRITGDSYAASPGAWNLWGFDREELGAEASIPDPADSTRRLVRGHWLQLLSDSVDVFLQQSGLGYRELLDLLGSYYVNPVVDGGRRVQIVADPDGPPDTCDTGRLQLQRPDGSRGVDEQTALRATRFIRLWRRLGWSMRDVDRAFRALAPAPAEGIGELLVRLSHVQRLHAALHVPVVRLLGWWAEIDHALYVDHSRSGSPAEASLYEQLFRNRAVLNPPDPAFTEDPARLHGTLSGHTAAIAAALQTSAADLTRLLQHPRVLPIVPAPTEAEPGRRAPDDSLTLANLSRLHRHAGLARALRLSVRDYLTALELVAADPFASTRDTLLFVETVGRVRESGFGFATLAYLLHHRTEPKTPIARPDESVGVWLDELRAGVQRIALENTFRPDPDDPAGMTADPDGALTRQKLALLDWDVALVEQVVATLAGTVVYETHLNTLTVGLAALNGTGAFETPLAALPPRFAFPAELASVATHEPRAGTLRVTRPLTLPEGESLRSAALGSGDPALAAAVEAVLRQQEELRGEIGYDRERRVLSFAGPMTNARRDRLLASAGGDAFQAAVRTLYDAPRRFVRRHMRTFDVPEFSVELVEGLPPATSFPPALRGRIYLDTSADPDRLRFAGAMTDAERESLLGFLFALATDDVDLPVEGGTVPDRLRAAFATHGVELDAGATISEIAARSRWQIRDADTVYVIEHRDRSLRIFRIANPDGPRVAPYRAAVDRLHAAADDPRPGAEVFLTAAGEGSDASLLFDQATAPGDRFLHVLAKLLPYLRRTLSERLAVQQTADALQIESRSAHLLLTRLRLHPDLPEPPQAWLQVLLSPAFAASNPNVRPTRRAFGAQFRTWTLLHKAALLVSGFRLTHRQLGWLLEYGPEAGWLDLERLPADAAGLERLRADADPRSNLFGGWLRLADLVRLRDALPQGESALDELFSLARAVAAASPPVAKDAAKAAWFASLVEWTGWNEADLVTLLGAAGDHTEHGTLAVPFPEGYAGERLLLRLADCFALLKRLGMSAELCTRLARPDVGFAESRQVRQSVRARYDAAQWLSLAKPLRDALREKQRAALVAYLVAHLRLPYTQRETPHPELRWIRRLGSPPEVRWLKEKLNAAGAYPALRLDATLDRATLDAVQAFQAAHDLPVTPTLRSVADAGDTTLALLASVRPAVRELKQKLNAAGASLKIDEVFDEWTHHAVVAFQNHHGLNTDGIVSDATWAALDRVRRSLRDADDLYVHFLIDVEMQPCMMTSRIKQAISSVQLFVQRCLLNLEPDVAAVTAEAGSGLSRDDAAGSEADNAWLQWKWMKSYRVWEANRKVFLYPENWIEPELRDDRSPFFRELESELLQSDLTLPTAEEAFTHYLEKLDQVARLEIVGVHHQVDGDILHVFGRTSGVPHVYFYRQRRDSAWTPWERVDLDIEGDHLIPVVWNRRLYLFWPLFTEKAEPLDPALDLETGTVAGVQPNRYWEIKLAWSTRRDGRWTQKQISAASLEIAHLPRTTLVCRSEITREDTLVIWVMGLEVIWVKKLRRFVWPGEFTTSKPHGGLFSLAGSHAEPTSESREDQVRGRVARLERERPTGTHHFQMYFRENDFDTEGSALFLPVSSSNRPALNRTPGAFLLVPYSDNSPISVEPFFFQDDRRTFFIVPSQTEPDNILSRAPQQFYHFSIFYHPYVNAFMSELDRRGMDGLLRRTVQIEPYRFVPLAAPSLYEPLDFNDEYDPEPMVLEPYPEEGVDFIDRGAYALYNWELFFHAPLLIADRLMKNQRHEEAQKWFHYIFDPTDTSSAPIPQRYWRTKPFFKRTREGYQRQQLEYLLRLLAASGDPATASALTPTEAEDLKGFRKAVDAWRKNPFNPHLVARMRNTAYQKTVVMKYIENLIAWGDQLFRRDTIESINEATQLYILAAEILGRRPQDVPPRAIARAETYDSLEPHLDELRNALVRMEQFVPPSAPSSTTDGEAPTLTLPAMLYFCIPKNDKLVGYWDTVADRLFKIRNCMNIEGVVRQLPLFEPPIDPALLVRAAAAGVDLGSVLNDVNAALPHYRFHVLAQKATELCSELKSLGAAMLSALEKHDAERLSLIRAQQETALLALVEQVRTLQFEEAAQNEEALRASRRIAVGRYMHYQNLLGVQSPAEPGSGETVPEVSPSPQVAIKDEGGFKIIPHEKHEMNLLHEAYEWQLAAVGMEFIASIAHIVPNFNVSPCGVGATFGGSNVASAASAVGASFRGRAAEVSYGASESAKLSHFAWRTHDWTLQSNQAAREITQIDKQLVAADIRKQIAEKELANHREQLENAREVERFMRDKFTSQELYGWMVGQLSGVYFQSYQLAYDVAKRAERAFRHELGLRDSKFIQFGSWDGLKKGLLAGERLHHDLKRMEVAYLDQHRREYEITRHISLAQIDPLALVRLRQVGSCEVSVPEALFDLDYPGHYLRRLKSVSITIPAITGPYTGVNCTLTLLKSSVRHAGTPGRTYTRDPENDDPRFTDHFGALQSIVTSNAQNDSGLFETNLRDERYLPFEGAGAISDWRIELPADFRSFDYDTIADVVLHLRYTARDGGAPLKQKASVELREAVNALVRSEGERGFARLFNLRHDFPSEWHRFLHPPAGSTGGNTLTVSLGADRFPFLFQGRSLTIRSIEVLVKVRPEAAATHNKATLQIVLAPGGPAPPPSDTAPPAGDPLTLKPWNGLLRGCGRNVDAPPGDWTMNAWLEPGELCLAADAIEDMMFLCQYQVA